MQGSEDNNNMQNISKTSGISCDISSCSSSSSGGGNGSDNISSSSICSSNPVLRC